MRSFKLSVLLAVSVLTVVPIGVSAQPFAGQQSGVVLDTIVVTPLRRATSLQSSTSSVAVIDREEIERSAAPDLKSLLKQVSGISLGTYGGQGSGANLYMRGMSPQQTLVLVNGVRTASASSGTTALFGIPLSAIERIEIAKGVHSSQYGSDALGGVINIITKQAGACGERSWCGSVSTGVTHPWGGYASGSIQGKTADGVEFAIGAAITGTQGYNFTTQDSWGHHPDNDGFLQGSLNLALAKDFEWGRLYADGLISRNHTEYDGYPTDESYSTNFAGKIGTRIDHSADWSTTIELSSGIDSARDYSKTLPDVDRFETKRFGIFASTTKEIQSGAALHSVTFGGEAYREKLNSTVDYDVTSRDLAAAFAQYSWEIEALRFDGGVRYDHNEQFGDVVTYNLGGSYEILPDLVLRSSFGTGFRAPTFNELYYPGYANPDLAPEKSRSFEIGMNWQLSAATTLDVAVYRNWLRNAIINAKGSDGLSRPYNVSRAEVTGLEATLAHQFDDRWGVKGMIDLKRPLDKDTDTDLPYRERVKMSGEINFQPIEKLDLTGRLHYGGSRYTSTSNTIKLKDYITVDFVALYQIDKQSKLKFSVENMFDKQYQTISGYIAPGRSFNIGLTRNF